MEISPGQETDLPALLELYAWARAFMVRAGNPTQWAGGRPSEGQIREDIAMGHSWVCREAGEILGAFAYLPGPDPTYQAIAGPGWQGKGPYGVIHRLALRRPGLSARCYDFALSRCPILRIDTHRDNIPMRRSLGKYGFVPCGTIRLEDGSPRLAYEIIRKEALP